MKMIVSSNVDGALNTKFQHTDVALTVADFKAITETDNSLLVDFTIMDNQNVVQIGNPNESIILFKNVAGEKRRIRITALNA